MSTADDYRYMARALELARRGLNTTDPNPRVGCVMVREGRTVGEGWHVRAGGPHAEVHALRQAGERAVGATLYVTLEPCSHHGRTPPCTTALIDSGVKRVVAAMTDPNPLVAGCGLQALRQAGIAVEAGILEAQAEALNPGFVLRMREGRPFIRCKLAMSLDGRTAMASGESKWITSEAARHDVHRLRARSSAIMTGVGTVLVDDPSLTARFGQAGEDTVRRQPVRVVLDTHLRTPVAASVFSQPGETWIMTAADDPARIHMLEQAGARVFQVPARDGVLDLQAVTGCLGQAQINEVLVEAGETLSGALLVAGLVDELLVYMAPHVMGDGARGLFRLPGITRMAQRLALTIVDVRAVGRDWRITALPGGDGEHV
jgi:diaminohydroxyphosphoribosylaminopyrimidine deaminase/5-amino-6-(5-phosphoribosylamino)uracil reductase